jgi:hypothetical protein
MRILTFACCFAATQLLISSFASLSLLLSLATNVSEGVPDRPAMPPRHNCNIPSAVLGQSAPVNEQCAALPLASAFIAAGTYSIQMSQSFKSFVRAASSTFTAASS